MDCPECGHDPLLHILGVCEANRRYLPILVRDCPCKHAEVVRGNDVQES